MAEAALLAAADPPEGAVDHAINGGGLMPGPDPWSYWTRLSRMADAAGRPRLARVALGRAIPVGPPDRGAYLDFAHRCLQVNRPADLAPLWDRALHHWPSDVMVLLTATACRLARQEYAIGLGHAEVALAQAPEDWRAATALAYCLATPAADQRARDRLACRLRLEWGDAGAVGFARAQMLLEQVTSTSPAASVWNDLGHLAALKGDLPQAEANFRTALALESGNRHASVNLAITLLRAGRGEALAELMATTRFSVDLPPALTWRMHGALDPDPAEWRRTTIFSFAWRRDLMANLARITGGAT